jgi:hypothetical protein
MHPWSHPFLRDAFRPVGEPRPETPVNVIPLKPRVDLDRWSEPNLPQPACRILSFPADQMIRKGRPPSYGLLSSLLSKLEIFRQKQSSSGLPN